MALRLKHWIAAVLLGCAGIAVAKLPPQPKEFDYLRFARPSASARAQVRRALASAYRLELYLQRRDEALALLRRAPRRPGTLAVLVDQRRAAAIPAARRERIVASVDSFARRVAPLDTSVHVAVFITRDTGRSSPGGWISFRGPWYVLPEAADGRACLVVVPLGARTPAPRTEAPSLLGPCAFYAAFGLPGPAVARWLETVDYYSADEPDWTTPRRRFALDYANANVDEWSDVLSFRARQGLTLEGSGCAAGKRESCRRLLQEPPRFSFRRNQGGAWAAIVEKWWWSGDDEQEWFLADLVRAMGRERFAQFWRSPLPRDSAFAQAFGMPIEDWTNRWLAERRPGVRIGPAIRLTSVVLGILFATVLVAGGVFYTTRRQVG